MARDIFKEDPFKPVAEVADDAGNVWPEVAGIFLAFSLAGGGKWLAVMNDRSVRDITFVLVHRDIEHVSGAARIV